jgi:segregation and condensation protein A
VENVAYQVKLEMYEGPLDLLLHLIEKEEVNIYDIPIARITDQYMEYMATWKEMNLEIASDFLVMAATLVLIKTRMLLPKLPQQSDTDADAAEEDPRAELVQRLLEYKKYKEAAARLSEMEAQRSLLFECLAEAVLPAEAQPAEYPTGLSLEALCAAFRIVLAGISPEEIARIEREEITVRQKVREIRQMLGSTADGVPFRRLFAGRPTRYELVITFIALLELIRTRQAKAYQSATFADIWLYRYQ